MRVTVGGAHLKHTSVDCEDRHIERTTAEVKDENVLLLVIILADVLEPVREGGGRGLVDDALDLEAGNGTGVLCRAALVLVKVRGHGNDGTLDVFAEKLFR